MNTSDLEKFLDLSSGQGAAVSEFAFLDGFEGFADFGSSGEFEFERFNGFVITELFNNNVIFRCGEGSGGQVADQTTVTLGGFLLGQKGESRVRGIIGFSFSITLRTGCNGTGSQSQNFEDNASTTECEGGSSGGGCGGGGSKGSNGLGLGGASNGSKEENHAIKRK